MSDQDRDVRIALNESRFREINDRVARDLATVSASAETIDFVCECGHLDCRSQIPLTLEEYEQVRQDSMVFAVTPGHQIPEAEDVLSLNDRYAVIRKHSNVQHVVEATDPRHG